MRASKGWIVTGISDAVQVGSENLPNLDPFIDIDPVYDQVEDLTSGFISDMEGVGETK